MNFRSKEYRLLQQDGISDQEADEYIDQDQSNAFSAVKHRASSILAILTLVSSLFTALIFAFLFFTLQFRYVNLGAEHTALLRDYEAVKAHMHIEKSPYASLIPEVPSTYYEATAYNDPENEDLSNELWESIDFDAGIVALSDEYAESKGLPIAQRFPWDETKGLYLLNAHHHLHCLKSIHRSIFEYRTGAAQSKAPWHLNHCLDALRREVICNADDTPRATTVEYSPNSGVGQVRQCKSWEKLEAWAVENTACFKYNASSDEPLGNYRACPDGSPYIDSIKKVFPG